MILTLDVLAALATLSDLEREIIVDRVVLGDTQTKIADRLGCTKSWIYIVERRALRKLRRALAVEHARELVAA